MGRWQLPACRGDHHDVFEVLQVEPGSRQKPVDPEMMLQIAFLEIFTSCACARRSPTWHLWGSDSERGDRHMGSRTLGILSSGGRPCGARDGRRNPDRPARASAPSNGACFPGPGAAGDQHGRPGRRCRRSSSVQPTGTPGWRTWADRVPGSGRRRGTNQDRTARVLGPQTCLQATVRVGFRPPGGGLDHHPQQPSPCHSVQPADVLPQAGLEGPETSQEREFHSTWATHISPMRTSR